MSSLAKLFSLSNQHLRCQPSHGTASGSPHKPVPRLFSGSPLDRQNGRRTETAAFPEFSLKIFLSMTRKNSQPLSMLLSKTHSQTTSKGKNWVPSQNWLLSVTSKFQTPTKSCLHNQVSFAMPTCPFGNCLIFSGNRYPTHNYGRHNERGLIYWQPGGRIIATFQQKSERSGVKDRIIEFFPHIQYIFIYIYIQYHTIVIYCNQLQYIHTYTNNFPESP